MLNEELFRVVHSFPVTFSIQFFARPDVTVTIDQAAVVECHFILLKVEGLAGYFKDPTSSPPRAPVLLGERASLGPTMTTPSYRIGSD